MPARSTNRLIDRRSELAILHAHLRLAQKGQPSLVLVEGDVGIGKTRLVDEFVGEARTQTLRGSCFPSGGQSLPFSPFVEMFRSIDPDSVGFWPDSIKALLPSAEQPKNRNLRSRIHLFQGVADVLEELADESTLAVILEDIQWADRSTVDLVSFLIALFDDQKLMLIATCRTEALQSEHPLKASILEWLRHSFSTRIPLSPLSEADASQLLVDIGQGALSEQDIQTIVSKAAGNPYFLQELATQPHVNEGSNSLNEVLSARIENLPEDLRDFLRLAALEGGMIDEQILADVSGLADKEIVRLLRLAIEKRIVVNEGNHCRFRQPLMVEALANDLLPTERREFHRAYANSLMRTNPIPQPQRLAFHQSGAGDFAAGLESYISAGAAAESQCAFAEAFAAYSSALQFWDVVARPFDVAGMTKIDLRRRQAEMAFLAGEPEEACRLVRIAIVELSPQANPTTRGLLHARLARYLCGTPNYGEALEIQLRAVETVPEEVSAERAGVLSDLAWIYQYEGLYEEAAEAAKKALDIAVAAGATASAISAQNTLGNAIAIIDDLDRGLDLIAGARELAHLNGDAYEEMRSLWNRWANLSYACRLEEALAASRELIDLLPRLGFAYELPEVIERNGSILWRLGRWDEAAEMIDHARSLKGSDRHALGLPPLHIARGDFAEAREIIAAKSSLARAGLAEMHLWNVVHLAELEAAENRLDEALFAVERVLLDAQDFDRPIALAHALNIGVRVAADMSKRARPAGESATIQAALETGEKYRKALTGIESSPGSWSGWRRELRALLRQADGEMARLRDEPAPDIWFEAAILWDGIQVPYFAAYCRIRWLESTLALEPEADVNEVLDDLLEIAENWEAHLLNQLLRDLIDEHRIRPAPTPASRYGLTNREIEVLAFLTRGATNRQIAQDLFISEKTAGVHVSSIIRKMAVANRGQAAAKANAEFGILQ